MANPTIAMPESLVSDVDERVRGANSRSDWVRGGIQMRLEIERAADAAGVDTDELPDGWWRDFLYSAACEYLREQREREQALEAD